MLDILRSAPRVRTVTFSVSGNIERVYTPQERAVHALDSCLVAELLRLMPAHVDVVQVRLRVPKMSYRARRTVLRNIDWFHAASGDPPIDRVVTLGFADEMGGEWEYDWPDGLRAMVDGYAEHVQCMFV